MEVSLNYSWRLLSQSCSLIWKLSCFRKWWIGSLGVWQPSVLIARKSNSCLSKDLHILSGSEVSDTYQTSHFLRMFWLPASYLTANWFKGLIWETRSCQFSFCRKNAIGLWFLSVKRLGVVGNAHFPEGSVWYLKGQALLCKPPVASLLALFTWLPRKKGRAEPPFFFCFKGMVWVVLSSLSCI